MFSEETRYLEPAYRSYKVLIEQLGYTIERELGDYSGKNLNNIKFFCTRKNSETNETEYFFFYVLFTSELSLEKYAKALSNDNELMDFAKMITARMVPFNKNEVIYMLLANRYDIDEIYQNKELKITDKEIMLLMDYANQKASFK